LTLGLLSAFRRRDPKTRPIHRTFRDTGPALTPSNATSHVCKL
jgi:hypothetical protein